MVNICPTKTTPDAPPPDEPPPDAEVDTDTTNNGVLMVEVGLELTREVGVGVEVIATSVERVR